MSATVPHITSAARELESRTSDGILIRLLWHPADGRVTVELDDSRSGERLEVEVRDGDRPLEVFRHPFAFAARRAERVGVAA
jgi:hypothetical protein